MLKNKKIVLGIIVAAFSFLFVNNNAMAIDSASINAKAAFEGVRNCFNSNAYNASFKASELSSNFASGIGPNVVKLPYNLGHNVSNNSMNCKDVMLGNGSRGGLNGGLLPDNIQNSSNANTVAKYFAGNNLNGNGGLGYTATADGGNIEGTGQSLTYNVTSSASECAGNAPVLMMTGTGTISVGGGSATTAIVFPTIAKSGNSITVNQDRTYNVPAPGSGVSYMFESSCAGAKIKIADVGSSSSPKYQVYVTDYNETASLDEYVSRFVIGTKVTNNGAEYTNTKAFSATSVTGKISLSASTEPVIVAGNSNNFSNDYTLTRSGGAYTALLRGLNGSGNRMGYNVAQVYAGYNYLALSRQEVYDLYKYYANNVLRLSITCKGDSNYAMYEGSGIPINWKGGDSACRVYNTGNVSIPANLYGVDSNRHFTATISSVQDIATALNNLGDLCSPKLDGVEGCGGSNDNPGTNPGGLTTGVSEDDLACDTLAKKNVEGKIGSMQWILCPGLDNTRYTASWVDNMTETWLRMDSDTYANSTVADVWGYLRNIANVLMVVFLLIVIISQLTGRGIDNYGIKKMLPRLIVMAIIVNLSLYICQIAVDLSNIAGVGLRNMFGTIAINATDTELQGTTFLGNMMMGMIASAGALGSAISVGTAAAQIAAGLSLAAPIAIGVFIALIILFLVILAGVAVLFLMLAARKIIVILCIILSPLAFASFILPNTQNLFKQWWNLFKAALVMFPICGAMSGISYLLRSMAGTMDLNAWGFAVMMILPYLGFFLLPVLLKNALGALGQVGTALTSLGNNIRSSGRQVGQTGARTVQNSQRFKELQQYSQERMAAQRAQRIHDRLSGRTDLSRRQQSQLRSADDVLLAQRKRDVENANRASGEHYNAEIVRQDLDARKEQRNATLYNDPNYSRAAEVKQDLALESEQRNVELYTDPNYATMMSQRGDIALHNEREKMWSERFADQDKVANSANLRNALVGQDSDQAGAAFSTLNSQGISETMTELYNADWNNMDDGVRNKVLTRMASSNVDSFKSFAKYRQSGGQKSFSDWMNGVGQVESGVKDATYAAHLNDLKEHAMDSYSKDEMEFINDNAADSLRTQLGAQSFGNMLRSAAINSKDPKMQTQAENIMQKQIAKGNMSVGNLGLTAENLGSMRGETIKAVRQGYVDNLRSRGYDVATANTEAKRLIQYELRNEISQAKADNRIHNRMKGDVKDILGIS